MLEILNPHTLSPIQENTITQATLDRTTIAPRKVLVDKLVEYNTLIGNQGALEINHSKLQDSQTLFVLTGQQLGFMGGPIYTILKGITTLALAKKHQAIPLFWLATEDHDKGEIDHTYLLDEKYNLKKFRLTFSDKPSFVEDLILTEAHINELDSFCAALEMQERQKKWALHPGMRFSVAMAKVLGDLFDGTGLLFIEPYALRSLATNFFLREIEHAKEIHRVNLEAKEKLLASGEEPILPLDMSTHLFLKKENGARQRIRYESDGYHAGENSYSKQQLIDLVHSHPELFSTAAASRPILQSLIIPTLAYISGPTELRYYQQLKEYHEFHRAQMPALVPRLSLTFIPEDAYQLLKQCKLDPWNALPKNWKDLKEIPQSIPPTALHYLNNLIHPKNRPQERVLNWWQFQAKTQTNLIQELLKVINIPVAEQIYCRIL